MADVVPGLIGLGSRFVVVQELGKGHVVDGGRPGGDVVGAEGGQRHLPEFGVERLVDENAGEVDAGIRGIVGFAPIDEDLELVVAEVFGVSVYHAAADGEVGDDGEGDVVDLVVGKAGQDALQAVFEQWAHQVVPYTGDDGIVGDGGVGQNFRGCAGCGRAATSPTDLGVVCCGWAAGAPSSSILLVGGDYGAVFFGVFVLAVGFVVAGRAGVPIGFGTDLADDCGGCFEGHGGAAQGTLRFLVEDGMGQP